MATIPHEQDAQSWSVRIRAGIVPGMREADVDKLMAPHARDRAWVPLGGSGARGLVFQLPVTVNAWFQLDGAGAVVAAGLSASARYGALCQVVYRRLQAVCSGESPAGLPCRCGWMPRLCGSWSWA